MDMKNSTDFVHLFCDAPILVSTFDDLDWTRTLRTIREAHEPGT